MPERIRLSRAKGWRKPEGAIVVARPLKWGNPWVVNPFLATQPPTNNYRSTVFECLALFRDWVEFAAPYTLDDIRNELGGHDLACWCPLDQPCHADVLLELANATTTQGSQP